MNVRPHAPSVQVSCLLNLCIITSFLLVLWRQVLVVKFKGNNILLLFMEPYHPVREEEKAFLSFVLDIEQMCRCGAIFHVHHQAPSATGALDRRTAKFACILPSLLLAWKAGDVATHLISVSFLCIKHHSLLKSLSLPSYLLRVKVPEHLQGAAEVPMSKVPNQPSCRHPELHPLSDPEGDKAGKTERKMVPSMPEEMMVHIIYLKKP